MGCRKAPHPLLSVPACPTVGMWGRLSETAIAFARSCSCGIETAVAFAREKWAFLVQFSGAEAMPVSRLPCWGRAVVLLVSTSPRCLASCAKKFAMRAQIGPNSAFLRVLGELFRGRATGGAVLGELFRANWPCAGLVGDAVPSTAVATGVLRHVKPSGGVSPACRRLGWRHSPLWWRWDRESRGCGRQSADPLGEKR